MQPDRNEKVGLEYLKIQQENYKKFKIQNKP